MNDELYAGGILQVKAYRLLQTTATEVVRAHGIGSVSEWFILAHACNHSKVIAKDLATLLDVEASLITRLLANLVDSELLSVRQYQADKRIKYIVATEHGRSVAIAVHANLSASLTKLLGGLTKDDLMIYKKVLTTILTNGGKS